MTIESPLEVHVELDPATREVVAAIKRWWDTALDGTVRALPARQHHHLRRRRRQLVEVDSHGEGAPDRRRTHWPVDHEDGNEPEELVTWHFWVGPTNYAETVPRLFAWADADVHEETYDDAEYDQYETECSTWDEDDQFFSESFDDWRQSLVAWESARTATPQVRSTATASN